MQQVFSKSRGTRIQAVLSALVLASLFVDLAAPPRAPGRSLAIVGALLLLSLAYLVSALGDRFVLGEHGVRYENGLLVRLGIPHARELRFDAIGSFREHRGRTLFIRDAAGKRFVIDAVEDYVALRDQILHAHAAARRAAAAEA